MRWFKHLSRSHLDTSLCRLMDEFGLEGYGAYWLLLEAIAEQCDDDNNTTLSMSHQSWRKVLPFYPKRLEKFAQCLGNLQLFTVEVSDSLITISCPKLLKYRDEYHEKKSRKSGHSPDNIPVEQNRAEQTRAEENKDTDKSQNDLSGAKPKKREKSDPRPNACPLEKWEKYLTFSRNFHQDRANTLGNIAPFTEAKVIAGAKALDTLVRIRGIDSREIQAVLAWAQGDSFWNDNIRALGSLTKIGSNGETKYSNILAAMRRDM